MTLPYVGPPAHFTPGDNLPPTRVVIHGTVSPTQRGGARDVARYFRSDAAGGSAHLVADPFEVVRVAHDNLICWGAPPNQHSLHIEFCDPQTGDPHRWKDADHQAMLKLGAKQVAAWCTKYDLPIVRLRAADLLKGKHGICGHIDVTEAWHQTSHTDPGPDFPWPQFLGMVVAAAHTAKHPAVKPPAIKPPTVAELLEMKLTDTITIPANYQSNSDRRHGKGDTSKPEKITVETALLHIYEWSFTGVEKP